VLGATDVTAYLIEKGLLRASQVVESGIEITNLSRRNRNFRVRVAGAGGFLLKQGSDPYKRTTLAMEARVYTLLHHLPGGGPERFLPRLIDFDEERSVLALELVDSDSLLDRHHRTGRLSAAAAAELGRSLALLHHVTGLPAVHARCARELDTRIPDALVLHAPSLTFYGAYASQGNIRLLRVVRRCDGLFRGLDRLRDEWRQECLVHGDLRWDNVLVPPREGERRALTLVDWELATLGDPCWDLACVFVEHLNFWLGSAPMTSRTAPEDVVRRAHVPLHRVQTSLSAFWRAYVAARGWSPAQADAALPRAVELAAARLVQSAIEQTQGSTTLNAQAVYQVQLAANILERPRPAAAGLLGLAADGAGPAPRAARSTDHVETARP
jgi:hypothetical protein